MDVLLELWPSLGAPLLRQKVTSTHIFTSLDFDALDFTEACE